MIKVQVTDVSKIGNEATVSLRVTLANGETVSGSATCWPESASPFGDSLDMWLSSRLAATIGSDLDALSEVQAHVLDAAR